MGISLNVNYYNQKEKELFKKYPNHEKIESIVNNEVIISKGEFIAYLMFTQQHDKAGWRTYEDLCKRTEKWLSDIDEYISYDEGSILSQVSANVMKAPGLTERIGVSLGLNVVNKLHELNEADWAITGNEYHPLTGKRLPDFDYEILVASDGHKFIQVENKGSVAKDNKLKSSSVSQSYSSIKRKKEDILEREKKKGISKHENLYYGTIGVLDQKKTAQVWLVDPPAFNIEWDPYKYKVISRLTFYLKTFKEVNVQPRLIRLLIQRIKLLIESEDITTFNKSRLISQKEILRKFVKKNHFASFGNNIAFGQTLEINSENRKSRFLSMLTKEAIKMVVDQDFDQIIKYNFQLDNDVKSFGFTISSKSLIIEFVTNESVKVIHNDFNGEQIAMYEGNIYTTSSGRVFGELTLQ